MVSGSLVLTAMIDSGGLKPYDHTGKSPGQASMAAGLSALDARFKVCIVFERVESFTGIVDGGSGMSDVTYRRSFRWCLIGASCSWLCVKQSFAVRSGSDRQQYCEQEQ